MEEDKIVAAILTVAHNSASSQNASTPETIIQTYKTFCELLRDKTVPHALKPLYNEAMKIKAAREAGT